MLMTTTIHPIKTLRRRLAGSCAASLLSLMTAGAALAAEPIYRIDLNKTQVLRLPSEAGSIIIGNPNIADVSIHNPQLIFVVGRGFGETNLVILDRAGQTMMDANIQVTSVTSSNSIRVFNASSRQTYSCAPFCQPSPVLGDEAEFIGQNSGQSAAPITQSTIFGPGNPAQGLNGPVGLTDGQFFPGEN